MRGVDLQEWVYNYAEPPCAKRVSYESIAPVKDSLLTETELADSRGIRRLHTFAERTDAVLVLWPKLAVVDDQEPRSLKQRIVGRRPPVQGVNPDTPSPRIVSVL